MRALFNGLVVALVFAGGVICPPDLGAADHVEDAGTEACHDCADWLGCGGCAIRAVAPIAEIHVHFVAAASVPRDPSPRPARPSTAEIFHPPRA